jgi:hypothetical protein
MINEINETKTWAPTRATLATRQEHEYPTQPATVCQKIEHLERDRRVRIVYRGLGIAFVVRENRDLEGNNFLAALGLC